MATRQENADNRVKDKSVHRATPSGFYSDGWRVKQKPLILRESAMKEIFRELKENTGFDIEASKQPTPLDNQPESDK